MIQINIIGHDNTKIRVNTTEPFTEASLHARLHTLERHWRDGRTRRDMEDVNDFVAYLCEYGFCRDIDNQVFEWRMG